MTTSAAPPPPALLEVTSVLDRVDAPCLVVDAGGSIRFANRAAAQWLGVPADSLVGRPSPVEAEAGDARRLRVRVATGERVVEVRTNELAWLGEEARMVTLRDVTGEQDASTAASEWATFLSHVLDSLNHPFFVVDVASRQLVIGNRAALGDPHVEEATADDGPGDEPPPWRRHLGVVDAVLRRGTAVVLEVASGGEPPQVVELHGYPVSGAGDGITQVAVSVFDVSERRTLEALLRRAQKMEAVGRLAGGVAHDFNNSLQAMQSLAESLRLAKDLPPRVNDGLKELEEQVQRAAQVARQLLLFARGEKPRLRDLDLSAVVDGTGRLLRRLLRENLELHLGLTSERLPLRGDPCQLEQVLANLAINAADAIDGPGRIEIRTRREAKDAVLEVVDTGVGIEPEVLERIFDPFFTTKGREGTGLGLAVVDGIVAGHGGHLGVRSSPGHGTTFTIRLPLATLDDATGEHGGEAAAGRGLVGAGERLLVVEDEPAVRANLAAVLEGLGYWVHAVTSAEEALAADFAPDLVITDLGLPGMSGDELVDYLHQRGTVVPAILLSGYAPTHPGRPEAKGRYRFLSKPCPLVELAAAVRDALAKGSAVGGGSPR